MKRLPGLALAARRELISYSLSLAPLRTCTPFVKDAQRPQTLTCHAHAVEVCGGGGIELIIKGAQFTDQYQLIRRLPAAGEFPGNARQPLPLTFRGTVVLSQLLIRMVLGGE